MQKIIRLGLFSIVFTFIFSIFSVERANAQGPLTEVLNRMEAHQKSLSSLKANVKMSKIDATLGEEDITVGTVVYLPQNGQNDYVRIDWTKPVEESLAVVKGSYVLYRPRLKQAICGETDKVKGSGTANNALAFMSMSKSQLKANYQVKMLGEEKVSGTSVAHLQLIPKTKSSYQSADIWVNVDGMPIQARVIEKNKDSTTIQLSSISKNLGSINGGIFKINLPKNVKCTRG
ncbi:MAG: outer membrane lipoprotein carrier protein LolA [Acidobacteriota bacterium]|nr:outer membrane lipoprotein carrier protein LolA [Acidobacteriota bacterium]